MQENQKKQYKQNAQKVQNAQKIQETQSQQASKSNQDMERYSIITEKNPREILLLRGRGCAWKKCTFCDYHLDYSKDDDENYRLNSNELDKITGQYHHLELINSGSFLELDTRTMNKILTLCKEKEIYTLHFESHWMYRNHIQQWREKFKAIGVELKIKIGVETFDYHYREHILKKGISTESVEEMSKYFDEVCLLQGLKGQTAESMKNDIELGLQYFERVCVNIMVENSTEIKPDKQVIQTFMETIYPIYKDQDRIDILLNNTDFGVGGAKENE